MELLLTFLAVGESDPKLTTAHISLYVHLWKFRKEYGDAVQLVLFSHEVMRRCKISSYSTYHKTIRELHEFGYIRYVPSFNRFSGSVIELVEIKKR